MELTNLYQKLVTTNSVTLTSLQKGGQNSMELKNNNSGDIDKRAKCDRTEKL